MGGGNFDTSSYTRSFSRSATTNRTVTETFKARSVDKRFDPRYITVRESRDSEEHPNSTPCIISLDGTGSMGEIPFELLTGGGLGRLMDHIYRKNTIPDPQIMTLVIGDIMCDSAPLQATQFESDNRIAEQLKDLYIERGGGGNGTESYDLTWLFAANNTSIDSFLKRGKKGYLFSIGDEDVPAGANALQLRDLFGSSDFSNMTAQQMLERAQKQWNCFHILCEETGFASSNLTRLRKNWDKFMGRHVLYLNNYRYLPELIIAVLEIEEGRDLEDVLATAASSGIRDSLAHAFK